MKHITPYTNIEKVSKEESEELLKKYESEDDVFSGTDTILNLTFGENPVKDWQNIIKRVFRETYDSELKKDRYISLMAYTFGSISRKALDKELIGIDTELGEGGEDLEKEGRIYFFRVKKRVSLIFYDHRGTSIEMTRKGMTSEEATEQFEIIFRWLLKLNPLHKEILKHYIK